MGEVISKMYYMWEDEICTEIILKKGLKVEFTNYTDMIWRRAFGVREEATYEDFQEFLKERCFPKERGNCKEILEGLGLDFYEPFEIVQKTHGVMGCDSNWIKFEGEDLKYKEVRKSMGLDWKG